MYSAFLSTKNKNYVSAIRENLLIKMQDEFIQYGIHMRPC